MILAYPVPFHIPIPSEIVPFIVLLIMCIIIGGWLILHLLGKIFEQLLETGVGRIFAGALFIIAAIVLGSLFPYWELAFVIFILVFIGIILLVVGIYTIATKKLMLDYIMKSGVEGILAGIFIMIFAFSLIIFLPNGVLTLQLPYEELPVNIVFILVFIGIIPLLIGIYYIFIKRSRYKKRMPSIPQTSPAIQRAQKELQDFSAKMQKFRQEKVKGEPERRKNIICAGVFFIILAICLGYAFQFLLIFLGFILLLIFFVIIGIILLVKGIYDISVERSKYKKRMANELPPISQSSPVEQNSTKENIQKILCPSCGVENLKSNIYCKSCGHFLNPS